MPFKNLLECLQRSVRCLAGQHAQPKCFLKAFDGPLEAPGERLRLFPRQKHEFEMFAKLQLFLSFHCPIQANPTLVGLSGFSVRQVWASGNLSGFSCRILSRVLYWLVSGLSELSGSGC